MTGLDILDVTNEQKEQICLIAEEAARKHVLSKFSSKNIEILNISAEVEGTKPLKLAVDAEIVLSPKVKGVDVQKLADDAVTASFAASEKYLRELACHSKT